MTSRRKTISSTIQDMFESDDGPKKLTEIYRYVLESGFEDRGKITKHSIRGIINKMHKTGEVVRVGNATYKKHDKSAKEPPGT